MQELLLFSHSQSLLKYWQSNIENDCVASFNIDSLFQAFDTNRSQIILFDYQSFASLFDEVVLEARVLKIPLFVLTGAPSFEEGSLLLSAKISGYGNSYMSKGNFQLALEVIESGKVWLYPDFVQALISNASKKPQVSNLDLDLLTPKELEVAHKVSEGMTNKEVAIALDITERTIKAHLTHIYEKLNISDRLTLALKFKV